MSLDQARAAGLSDDAVQRRVDRRAWRQVGPRVYQAADHEMTPRSRIIAAMLSLGEHATLVGRSAGWWWNLHDTPPALVEVAVAPTHRPRPRLGVEIRRRGVEAQDRTVVRGIAVTAKAATVLDAAVALGLAEGARLMDRALQRERVTLQALRDVHARTSGRHGAQLAAELIALAAGGARSEAERVVHGLLDTAGLDGWSANDELLLPSFGPVVGDVVFRAERVIVEVDGWAYHRDLRAFLRDGPRQSALAAAGWIVIRTHWYEVLEDPERFLATLRRVLARSGTRERTPR